MYWNDVSCFVLTSETIDYAFCGTLQQNIFYYINCCTQRHQKKKEEKHWLQVSMLCSNRSVCIHKNFQFRIISIRNYQFYDFEKKKKVMIEKEYSSCVLYARPFFWFCSSHKACGCEMLTKTKQKWIEMLRNRTALKIRTIIKHLSHFYNHKTSWIKTTSHEKWGKKRRNN